MLKKKEKKRRNKKEIFQFRHSTYWKLSTLRTRMYMNKSISVGIDCEIKKNICMIIA